MYLLGSREIEVSHTSAVQREPATIGVSQLPNQKYKYKEKMKMRYEKKKGIKWIVRMTSLCMAFLMMFVILDRDYVTCAPSDKTKNITGFMQDPKKNYNTKNKYKISKVKVTSFKNRYTTPAEQKKYSCNTPKKQAESYLGSIMDERIFYAEEFLTQWDEDGYILKYVKKYDKSRMAFQAGSINSFSQMIDMRWNKVSKVSGYEIRIKQYYNKKWTDWTYRRTTANHVKIFGLDGGRKITTPIYDGAKSPHNQKYKWVDEWTTIPLSTGCTYKVQVRAFRVVNGKYYYGAWSDAKKAGKIARTPYTLIEVSDGVVMPSYSMNIRITRFNYDYRIGETKEEKNPFATKPVGFQVQVADNSSFTDAVLKKYPTTDTSLQLTDIPKGKFVRVRTYNDKSAKTVYGEWSETVKVK